MCKKILVHPLGLHKEQYFSLDICPAPIGAPIEYAHSHLHVSDHLPQLIVSLVPIHIFMGFVVLLIQMASFTCLDTLMKHQQDGNITFTVYRKPTHTDQYLHFKTHHPLHQKLGVVSTLLDRCKTVVTKDEDKIAEAQHIEKHSVPVGTLNGPSRGSKTMR